MSCHRQSLVKCFSCCRFNFFLQIRYSFLCQSSLQIDSLIKWQFNYSHCEIEIHCLSCSLNVFVQLLHRKRCATVITQLSPDEWIRWRSERLIWTCTSSATEFADHWCSSGFLLLLWPTLPLNQITTRVRVCAYGIEKVHWKSWLRYQVSQQWRIE